MPTNPWSNSADKAAIDAAIGGKTRPGNYIRFTESGTYVPTEAVREVYVVCIGGGGGGATGRVGAEDTLRRGGHGGGGGGWSDGTFSVAELGEAVEITIGAGGAGAPALSTPDSDGIPGSAGGDTYFGSLLFAGGGPGGLPGDSGGGGTTSTPGGVGSITGSVSYSISSGGAVTTSPRALGLAPGGGGSGGRRDANNALSNASPGMDSGTGSPSGEGGSAGLGTAGAPGGAGTSRVAGDVRGGTGGGGSVSGVGGAGGFPGGGGGGTNAKANGDTALTGGAGAPGCVHIFERF